MDKAPHAEVAKRAYEIWEREGRPHGRDFDHWLKAEREMEAETTGLRSKATAATPAGNAARPTTRTRKPKKTEGGRLP